MTTPKVIQPSYLVNDRLLQFNSAECQSEISEQKEDCSAWGVVHCEFGIFVSLLIKYDSVSFVIIVRVLSLLGTVQ